MKDGFYWEYKHNVVVEIVRSRALHTGIGECYNPEEFDFGEDPKPIVKPEFVDTPEDIELKGEEILCWDGCQWHIDYVDSDVESGCFFMANGTEVEAWLPMPGKPVKK